MYWCNGALYRYSGAVHRCNVALHQSIGALILSTVAVLRSGVVTFPLTAAINLLIVAMNWKSATVYRYNGALMISRGAKKGYTAPGHSSSVAVNP